MFFYSHYFICFRAPDTEIKPLGQRQSEASKRKIKPKTPKFQAGKSISPMESTRCYLKCVLPSSFHTFVLMAIQLQFYKKIRVIVYFCH